MDGPVTTIEVEEHSKSTSSKFTGGTTLHQHGTLNGAGLQEDRGDQCLQARLDVLKLGAGSRAQEQDHPGPGLLHGWQGFFSWESLEVQVSGPPGTGKSSLISAIANYTQYDVYDMELTEVKSNADLRKLLMGISNKAIIMIEDINCSLELKKRGS
ncbi:hypothetical protein SELMODRAFT_413949 [Selaginella moellendorffii]|uniref:ATPase AAA-type core domain-containing protein n=1 Tax=Selaginella moellendorffii TaxID=88036 RepID=D8RR54_SELML|nr:hypothetical protein SELMODRAFT_413949 [Selaginella moellendorffii]